MYKFYEIISAFLTIGGIGFINYIVTDKLGTTNVYKDSNQIRLGYCLVWSMIDFSLYLAIRSLLSNCFHIHGEILLISGMLLTIFFTFIITLIVAWPIHDLLFRVYSFVNKKHHVKTFSLDNQTIWHKLLHSNQKVFAYIYDFDRKPLGCGIVSQYTDDELQNYGISLQPFNNDDGDQASFNDMINTIQEPDITHNYDIEQYIDFKQKFIIFVWRKW